MVPHNNASAVLFFCDRAQKSKANALGNKKHASQKNLTRTPTSVKQYVNPHPTGGRHN